MIETTCLICEHPNSSWLMKTEAISKLAEGGVELPQVKAGQKRQETKSFVLAVVGDIDFFHATVSERLHTRGSGSSRAERHSPTGAVKLRGCELKSLQTAKTS